MGITARYYRKSAGNFGRDRRAPVIFDPRSGPCGRFPLIPLHSRLPRHDPGPSPACENSPRPTIDGKRPGSKPHEQEPRTGTNRLAVTASMANPCFGGGEGYSLVDGVEAGAHVFEGVVEARRQPLYEFRTSSRQTGNNPDAGACHFVVHEKWGISATSNPDPHLFRAVIVSATQVSGLSMVAVGPECHQFAILGFIQVLDEDGLVASFVVDQLVYRAACEQEAVSPGAHSLLLA
jgi:hypothetical protein